MARPARVEIAGGIHHVTSRGNRKEAIFRLDGDRRRFMRDFADACDYYDWMCLSYCLMTNHFHLVVETAQETLGAGMQRFLGRYGRWFNDRYDRVGHVYQGRYHSVLVDTDEYLAQLLRYVALNPVKDGLCADPGDWQWSRHRELLQGCELVEDLLGAWGGELGERYAQLFDPAHPVAVKFGDCDPWDYKPPLRELLAIQPSEAGMLAARAHGYRLADIASATGLSESTVSRRTATARKGSDPFLAG